MSKQKIAQLIDNIGRENYQKIASQNIREYGFPAPNPHDKREIDNILKITMQRKANIYKDKEIPLKYIDNYVRQEYPDSKADNDITYGMTDSNFNPPQTKYFKPILTLPIAGMRNTIGHELGHAKYRLDTNEKIEKVKDKYKNNPDKLNKAINKIENKYSKTSEAQADKNISTYLKQMDIPKNERRAHYRLHKDSNNPNGRYQSRFGNLKYIKDYIFGFSRPLSPEWKEMIRNHLYFSNKRK